MKIKYLGTSAAEGIPGLFCNCVYCNEARRRGGKDLRTRSQSIIDNTLLIDFPADSLSHMYKYEIPISHIHNILITHTHQDHLYLEDFGLRSKYYGFAHNIDQMLTVYGNDTFIKKFDAMYPQNSHYEQAKPNITCRELTEYKTVDIDGYNVTALLARHDPNEKCFIYYIERGGTSLLYGNDTGWFPEPTWKFLADKTIDLVSLDCTFAKYAEGSGQRCRSPARRASRGLPASASQSSRAGPSSPAPTCPCW